MIFCLFFLNKIYLYIYIYNISSLKKKTIIIIIKLGLVLLNIIEISRWYKEDAPLMIIAIALMDISILCGMILFFIGLKKVLLFFFFFVIFN